MSSGVRDQLVRVVEPKPPMEIILGVANCPCIHITRHGDLINIRIERNNHMIEAFSLTTPEQARLREALERL